MVIETLPFEASHRPQLRLDHPNHSEYPLSTTLWNPVESHRFLTYPTVYLPYLPHNPGNVRFPIPTWLLLRLDYSHSQKLQTILDGLIQRGRDVSSHA
jgi:hypothetical protein